MELLARKNQWSFFALLIRLGSWSIYNHVEIVPVHTPISSSEQDGGVRWAAWISGNPKKWDRYEVLDVTNIEEETVVQWCNRQVGKGYDWRGIAQYFNPFRKNKTGNQDDWYCSEFVHVALCQIRTELRDYVMKNPANLIRLLLKLKLIRLIEE